MSLALSKQCNPIDLYFRTGKTPFSAEKLFLHAVSSLRFADADSMLLELRKRLRESPRYGIKTDALVISKQIRKAIPGCESNPVLCF